MTIIHLKSSFIVANNSLIIFQWKYRYNAKIVSLSVRKFSFLALLMDLGRKNYDVTSILIEFDICIAMAQKSSKIIYDDLDLGKLVADRGPAVKVDRFRPVRKAGPGIAQSFGDLLRFAGVRRARAYSGYRLSRQRGWHLVNGRSSLRSPLRRASVWGWKHTATLSQDLCEPSSFLSEIVVISFLCRALWCLNDSLRLALSLYFDRKHVYTKQDFRSSWYGRVVSSPAYILSYLDAFYIYWLKCSPKVGDWF